MACPNPSSQWASAPLLVPKHGPVPFRFTVDLRPVNKFTIRHQYPMPNLEQELTKLSGSKYFANFDFSHAYWQLPLHPDSQSLHSFITPDGVFSPTRILHGTTNAVMHLQSSVEAILKTSLKRNTLLWLNDILIFSSTIDHLLELISEFIQLCKEYGLFLHRKKCLLITTSVRWCGRLIQPQGVTFDPSDSQGIFAIQKPTKGAQLQQFLCTLQWIRTTIPEFSEVTQPLREFSNKILSTVSSRSKRSTSLPSLSAAGWGKLEDDCFSTCKKVIGSQVTLAHRDKSRGICLFTDASDTCCSGFIYQIPPEEIGISHVHQHHERLAFLPGHFSKTELGWSTLEKEAYVIMECTKKM